MGLNSAQFTKGLANAQTSLGKFGSIAARGFTAVAAAATVAAGALGIAVKGAIDHADALSKASQKAGVAVEALSRLEYAAKLSDVSLESLTGGLQKLSKSMADVAAGGGPQTAFAALGIAVKDAAGNLRDSDVVFAEIADRFSRIEDGATKTALAMKIFGKSGGELIPLLNEGRDGLKAMADESDRLGATISTKTAKGAEKFNDTLTKVGQILQGVVNKVMEAALPALQGLADTLASEGFREAAVWLGTTLVGAINLVANAFVNAYAMAKQFGAEMMKWGAVAANVSTGNWAGALAVLQAGELQKTVEGFGSSFTGGWGGKQAPAEITVNGGNKPPANDNDIDLDKFTSGVKKAQEALDPFQARFEELRDVLTPTSNAFEQMQLDLTDLETMWQHGRISVEQYGDAVRKVQLNSVASVAGMASEITGILGQMFEDNKAIAVANAVVSGIEGVAKALSAYPPPFSFIMAGLQGAAAAVQVGNILSTNKNSKSMPGSSTSPSSSGAANSNGPGGIGQAVTIVLKGKQDSGTEELADRLADLVKDGGGNKLVRVIREAA